MNHRQQNEARKLAEKEIQREIAGWMSFNQQEKSLRSTVENNRQKRDAVNLIMARLAGK